MGDLIGSLIGLVIIIGFLFFAIAYWPIALAIGVVNLVVCTYVVPLPCYPGFIILAIGAVGPVISLIGKANEEGKRRQAAEASRTAAEMARLQRHRDEQQGYYQQIVVLGDQSISLFESMPKHLEAAEKCLDQAEVDFADGAFAPFWDSIENAIKWLAHFDEGVHHIKDNTSRYTEMRSGSMRVRFLSFPLHVSLSKS